MTTTATDKWTQIRAGNQVVMTEAELDWIDDNLPEPEASIFRVNLAISRSPGGYLVKLIHGSPQEFIAVPEPDTQPNREHTMYQPDTSITDLVICAVALYAFYTVWFWLGSFGGSGGY